MALSKKMQAMMMQANKRLGETRVTFASEGLPPQKHYSFGSKMIDRAVHPEHGGLPEGKIIEIFGPEAAGKTSVCLLAIAARQKIEEEKAMVDPSYEEKACLFIDAEQGFSEEIAQSYGVQLDKLVYIQPKTAEQAIDLLDGFIRSGEIGLAVVDSVAALTPSKIEESSIEQQTMGLVARLLSTACQKLNGACNQYNTTIIFINQIREKVGVMYGNPETTPGGRALKYYSWLRIKVTRAEDIKAKEDVIGHVLKIQMVKNKSGRPKTVANTELIYGIGYSPEKELFTLAQFAGIIQRSGSWFTVIDHETGEILEVEGTPLKYQGQVKFMEAMKDNPAMYRKINDILEQQIIELSEEELETGD